MEVSLPPTIFWGNRVGKPVRWGLIDLLLVHALKLYQKDICPRCHQPSHLSYDSQNSGEWTMASPPITCESCSVKDLHDQEQAKLTDRPIGELHYLKTTVYDRDETEVQGVTDGGS